MCGIRWLHLAVSRRSHRETTCVCRLQAERGRLLGAPAPESNLALAAASSSRVALASPKAPIQVARGSQMLSGEEKHVVLH